MSVAISASDDIITRGSDECRNVLQFRQIRFSYGTTILDAAFTWDVDQAELRTTSALLRLSPCLRHSPTIQIIGSSSRKTV